MVVNGVFTVVLDEWIGLLDVAWERTLSRLQEDTDKLKRVAALLDNMPWLQ